MHPLGRVKLVWTPKLAYAIGLITTDGNLSPDGRHISFTTKDLDQAITYRSALGIQNKIGKKSRGHERLKRYFVVQFGDVLFYRFLLSIGLMPRKSLKLGEVRVPKRFFYDFFRGCIDGDGNIHTFRHPESRHPQLRLRLCSGSKPFLVWIHGRTQRDGLRGFITTSRRIYVLAYGIKDSKKLFRLMYYEGFTYGLKRKYNLAKQHMRA